MAKLTVDQKTSTMFRITAEQLDSIYTSFEDDLTAQIDKFRAMGLSQQEIFKRLTESLNNGMDYFQSFKGAIEKQIDDLVGTTSQLSSNDFGLTEMLTWELDPTVVEHCDDCLRNSESGSRSFSDWELIGLPGMGNTQCGSYCRCTLAGKE